MLIVVEFLDIGLVLTNQLNGQRKRAGRIGIIIEVNLPMDRTSLQDLGLQRNFDRDRAFFFHCGLSLVSMLCEESPSRSWFGPFDILSAGCAQLRAARGAMRPLAGRARADRAAPTAAVQDSEYWEYSLDAWFAPLDRTASQTNHAAGTSRPTIGAARRFM
jgi:hypothetical protein